MGNLGSLKNCNEQSMKGHTKYWKMNIFSSVKRGCYNCRFGKGEFVVREKPISVTNMKTLNDMVVEKVDIREHE